MTLLFVHIWLPAKILGHLGLNGWIPLLRLRVWHLCLPQLLIPFQLLVFHLCMLALLEKGKNFIGAAQHRWLVRFSSLLGLSDYLLPKSIDKFVYVGSRPIFLGAHATLNGTANNRQLKIDDTGPCLENKGNLCELRTEVIDNFWEELEKMSYPSDNFIKLNLSSVVTPGKLPTYERGVTKRSGKRHLKSSERYICLPDGEKTKIPTAIGPYRLRRQSKGQLDALKPITEVTIEFWKEVPGSPIPRPPEGWDDLREDGAKAGRWAWGGEVRSPIEEGVAHRSAFMQSDNKFLLWAKILLLLVVSWAATLMILLSSIYLPIILGRTFFSLLSLPEKYHHDPLNFAIGFSMYLPFLFNLEMFLGAFRHGYVFERLKKWVTRFRRPPSAAKTRVLILSLFIWVFLAPLSLGLSYHLNASRDRIWWGEKRFLSPMDFFLSWISGSLLFNLWAVICYFDMFRRNVLLNMGLDINGRRANQNFDRINEDVVGSGRQWQGREGRIAIFVKSLYEILSTCEWEKVDHVVLLERCAFPILRALLVLIIIPVSFETLLMLINGCLILSDEKSGKVSKAGLPILSSFCKFYLSRTSILFYIPLAGITDCGAYRLAAFRTFSLVTVSFQLIMVFQEPLKSWFEKAHRAARDDRYLIGETLLNWKEKE
jgi:E3 ubiquitin-protein ligase MARCH6